MTQITIQIEGMMCGMCESHINDVIRKKFPVKNVSSSHTKNQTVILTESDIDDNDLKDAIEATGYHFISTSRAPYEKKGLFGRKK